MSRALKKLSIDEMLAEIKRRNSIITKLNRNRSALLDKVAAIEAEIRAKGGEIKSVKAARAGGKRPKNAASLPDSMAKVMSKDKPMSVANIEAAVKKAGYTSTSPTFKTIIFQALAKDKRFKKVSRGQYALRAPA